MEVCPVLTHVSVTGSSRNNESMARPAAIRCVQGSINRLHFFSGHQRILIAAETPESTWDLWNNRQGR